MLDLKKQQYLLINFVTPLPVFPLLYLELNKGYFLCKQYENSWVKIDLSKVNKGSVRRQVTGADPGEYVNFRWQPFFILDFILPSYKLSLTYFFLFFVFAFLIIIEKWQF